MTNEKLLTEYERLKTETMEHPAFHRCFLCRRFDDVIDALAKGRVCDPITPREPQLPA